MSKLRQFLQYQGAIIDQLCQLTASDYIAHMEQEEDEGIGQESQHGGGQAEHFQNSNAKPQVPKQKKDLS